MSTAFKTNSLRLAGIAGSSLLLSKVKPEWGQRFLYNHLKKFPGVPAKFSQWLEQKWDLHTEMTQPLLTVEEVRQILASEVPNLEKQIDEISEQAWVASIGQVHRVTLKDGRVLAVKVQYPGLADEVKKQIDQLIWMMEKSPAKRYGFQAETWRTDLLAMFGEELDYWGEMRRQQQFKEMVGPEEWVLVPEVYPEWCSSRVLTQSYLEGETLERLGSLSLPERHGVAQSLAGVLVRMLLSSPLLHSDLQPKNWGWCLQRQKVILYDFGSCITWNPFRQRLFESLIQSIKTARGAAPLDYLVAFGFDREKLLPIHSQLPPLVENLLEPFWNGRLTKWSDWQMQKMTHEILGEQSWYFRTAGPPWFLWLMRSLSSVFYALRELSDRVVIPTVFNEEQQRLAPDRWAEFEVPSQAPYLEKYSRSTASFSQQAQFLYIRVMEGSEQKVSLRFPIHLLQNLEDLMEGELLEKLQEQNLDIHEIKRRAYRSGLIKQELFSTQKEDKTIRIWIA